MATPEFVILCLNFLLILVTYFFIYPKFAGADLSKLLKNDLAAMLVSLTVAGSLYWDSGYEFNALLTNLNWFWFALLTYIVMEIPFSVWYFKKHKLFQIDEDD